MLSEKYQTEQSGLETQIQALTNQLDNLESNSKDVDKWIALVKSYTCPTELSAELLNTLIEKILVHEAVKTEDGMREQKVEIFYRFVGKLD